MKMTLRNGITVMTVNPEINSDDSNIGIVAEFDDGGFLNYIFSDEGMIIDHYDESGELIMTAAMTYYEWCDWMHATFGD